MAQDFRSDDDLISQITEAVDFLDFNKAKELIDERLALPIDTSQAKGRMLKIRLAGWLIDIGNESNDRNSIQKGLLILERDRALLSRAITESSYEYNLGNGYKSLFDSRERAPDFKLTLDNISEVLRAKSHYWRSYRKMDLHDRLRVDLLVNLGNCLRSLGRGGEAVQYYDAALNDRPGFPQATFNRSRALTQLSKQSGTFSTEMLRQIWVGYKNVAENSDIPNAIRESGAAWARSVKESALKTGIDLEKPTHEDVDETEKEYSKHSSYRKFCIREKLSLSEHAIYCGCAGARRDNLTIPTTNGDIYGDFVPRSEFLLNRIKSEFAFARLLYYQAAELRVPEWETYDDEEHPTELFENDSLGAKSEMLRSSFRSCFGILDKIASGISELFSLAEPNEKIYFENFWNRKPGRLKKIFEAENPNLIALYSIATDLNSTNGDWPEFKKWRNALEHRILSIPATGEKFDPFSIINEGMGDIVVEKDEFHQRALFLLRLTHAAIISFALCVRHEGRLAKPLTEAVRVVLKGRSDFPE